MQLKICGITQDREVELLDSLAVDFVGLWHGVPGGHAELPLAACARLAGAARATGRLQPVLVTLLGDVDALERAVTRTGVPYVQLHGYQSPALVAALRRAIPATTRIIKALHIRGGRCLEMPLVGAYENAGAELFLLDAVDARGRVGSTGRAVDGDVALSVARRLARPFLLAGGIGAESGHERSACAQHPGCLGADVDSNARGRDGALDRERIEAISRAWKDTSEEGQVHVEYV